MVRMVRSPLLTALLIAGVLSCTDRLGPSGVAGMYALESVDGVPVPLPGTYAQVRGSFTLTATGFAERRVVYRIDDQGTEQESVESGTFTLADDSVLHLSFHAGNSSWTRTAILIRSAITLRLPSPVDGPDIVELYRLQ